MVEMFNVDAERRLLGAAINNDDSVDLIKDIVTADDFGSVEHKRIYQEIINVNSQGVEVELFDIAQRIKNDTGDDLTAYVMELAAYQLRSYNIVSYANSVVEKSKLRNMINVLDNQLSLLKNGIGSTTEKLLTTIAAVNSIEPETYTNASNLHKMEDVAKQWLNDYEEKITKPESAGITTGIGGIDEIIGARGIQAGDVVVIAARPKMFKTATMTKIVNHIGVELKKPVINFSMEMRKNLMFERTLTQQTGVTGDNFYKQMSEENFARVYNAMPALIESQMYIDDRSNLTLSQIRSEARKKSQELGGYGSLGGIAIDYFTLMHIENTKNPSFEYAQISKGVVALAKELGCPIFLLAQLNRDCEKRPDKRPMPYDLGDTGQLERDASLIVMLYNDAVYNEDSAMKGILELIVRVNRNGNTGTAYQAITNGRLTDIDSSEIGLRMAENEYQEKQSYAASAWN